MNINTTKCQLGISYLSTKSLIKRICAAKKETHMPCFQLQSMHFPCTLLKSNSQSESASGTEQRVKFEQSHWRDICLLREILSNHLKVAPKIDSVIFGDDPLEGWDTSIQGSLTFRGDPLPLSPFPLTMDIFTPEPWALQRQPTHFSKTRH